MRVSVDAVLVVRHGGEHLDATLQALAKQSRAVTRVCLVDASADSTLGAQVDAALVGSSLTVDSVAVAYDTSFAEAISEAVAFLFPEGTVAPESWLWLLRDDTPPEPDALQQLVVSVEGAPLVRVAGPKQRMTHRPRMIREMGETMTLFGERIALAERELDQAQYDRLSDVLGVGEAGMLVNTQTLLDVEGFDAALTPLDGGLDLCVRARLAGHRVVVVPRAVVQVGSGPADWHAGKEVSTAHQHYLSRRSWLYRRMTYATAWAVIPLLLWLVPWSIVRAATSVLQKHPERLVGEVMAAAWVLWRLPRVLDARGSIKRTSVASFATINSLRMPVEDVGKRKAAAYESALADKEEKALATPRPPFFPAVPWLLVALVALSGLIHGRWWGSDVLLGGGLVPLAPSLESLWDTVWATPSTVLGLDQTAVPADPAQLIFAVLGSLTWWQPSLALVGLFLVAIPLSGWTAWWGLSQVLSKAWTTAVFAGVWALSPTLLLALNDGRVPAVIAHIALPWLVGALLTSHESWQRVGQASLATVIVLAATPVLWPAVVVGFLVVGMSRAGSHSVRMFAGVIPLGLLPAALLAWPRFSFWWESVEGQWWQGLGVALADPGKAVAYDSAPWWNLVAGWPTIPEPLTTLALSLGLNPTSLSVVLGLLALPLLVLAVVSLVVGRPSAAGSFAALFVVGLVTALGTESLFMGFDGFTAVFVWPGTAVSVMVLGLLVGAGATLDQADFRDSLGNTMTGPTQWLTRVGGVGVVVMATLLIAPFVFLTWAGHQAVQPASAWRTLPAFVAAEAATNPSVGTLIITDAEDGFAVSLQRGAGPILSGESSLIRGRSVDVTDRDKDIATIAATLVRPSAFDPSGLLADYGIRFIVLQADEVSAAAIALANRPELVSASSGESGQLWQVPAVAAFVEPAGESNPSGTQLWALVLVGLVGLLALPTERRAKPGSRFQEDALPTLGEDTSDDL
jgi:GT2 family glycosyltransferase